MSRALLVSALLLLSAPAAAQVMISEFRGSNPQLQATRQVFTDDFAGGTDADLDGHANWERRREVGEFPNATITHNSAGTISDPGVNERNPYAYVGGTTNGLNQFVLIEADAFSGTGTGSRTGGVFRDTDADSKFYTVEIQNNGNFHWFTFTGTNGTGDPIATSCDAGGINNGDYIGTLVEDTSTDTIVRGCIFTSFPGTDPSTWDCTVSGSTTWECCYYISGATAPTDCTTATAVTDPADCGTGDNETCIVNTGNQVGVTCTGKNSSVTCDNWSGGDR